MITIEPPRSTVANADVWAAWGLSRPGLTRFANKAQDAVGLAGEVEILLAGDATLRRLNRDYRKKDKATDVLSFPAPEGFGDGHAGDLAISLQTAQRQADEHGHSLDVEVRILLLHGLLHLAGLDHETDSGEMAERESELRKKLKLPLGLIDRAAEKPKRAKTGLKRSKTTLKASKTPRKLARKMTRKVPA